MRVARRVSGPIKRKQPSAEDKNCDLVPRIIWGVEIVAQNPVEIVYQLVCFWAANGRKSPAANRKPIFLQ